MKIGEHAVTGILEDDKTLEKTNNLIINTFIQESLTTFYLPDSVCSCLHGIKLFYSNVMHVTHLAHAHAKLL